mmetsp:Transcript_7470/g.33181  ORF Transcript_7470/g.33181 Transcript_7470/m.33181 type:complete len:1123 (-) Transcript_7470:498-3866(-)
MSKNMDGVKLGPGWMPLTRKTGLSVTAVAVDESPQGEVQDRKVKQRFSKAEILSVYRSYPVVPRGMQEHPGVTVNDPLVPVNLSGDGQQEQHAAPRVEKLRLTSFDKPNQGEHVINSPAANQRRGLSAFGQGGSPTAHGGIQNRKSTGSGASQSTGDKSSPYWTRGMRSLADSNVNWRGSSKVVPTSPPTTPSPSLPPLMPTNRRDLSAFTKQSTEKDKEREKGKNLDDQQKIWQYRDPQMIVQGPFSARQLMDWLKAGYYSEDLPVRALEETEFRPLATVFGLRGEENAPPGFTKGDDDFVADPSAAGDAGNSLNIPRARGESSGEFFELDQVGPKFHDDGDDRAVPSEILHQQFSGMVLDSNEQGGDSEKPSDSLEEGEQTTVRPTITQRTGGYSSSLPTTSRFANVMRGQLVNGLHHDVSSAAGGKPDVQEADDSILPVHGLGVTPTGDPPIEYRSTNVDGEGNVPSILDLLANSVADESKSTEQKAESLMAIDPAIASFGCQVESKQTNSDQWWLERKVGTTNSVEQSPPHEASDQYLVSRKEATPNSTRQVGSSFSSANQSGTGYNSPKELEPNYGEAALGLGFGRSDIAGVRLTGEQEPHIAGSVEGSVSIHGLNVGNEAARTQKGKSNDLEQDVVGGNFTGEKEFKVAKPDDLQQSAEIVRNAKVGKGGAGASTKQMPPLSSDERANTDTGLHPPGAAQQKTEGQWETVEAPGSRGKNREQRQNLETRSAASLETQAQPQTLIIGRGVEERTNRGESNGADAVSGVTVKEEYSKQPTSSRGTAAAPWTASNKATTALDAMPSLKDIQQEEAKRAEEQKKRNMKQAKLRKAQAPKAGAGGPAWGGVAVQQAKSTSLVDILREEASQKAKEDNARMKKKDATPATPNSNSSLSASRGGAWGSVAPPAPSMSLKEQMRIEEEEKKRTVASALPEQKISTPSGWAAKVAGANRPPEQAAALTVHRPVPNQKQIRSTGAVQMTASAHGNRPTGAAGSTDQDGENFWEAAEASLREKGSGPHEQAGTLLTASVSRTPAARQTTGSAVPSVSRANPPHQSMSAKQNAFGASMSPDFTKWCQGEMRKITGSSDTTLPEFLLTLPSAWEVKVMQIFEITFDLSQ